MSSDVHERDDITPGPTLFDRVRLRNCSRVREVDGGRLDVDRDDDAFVALLVAFGPVTRVRLADRDLDRFRRRLLLRVGGGRERLEDRPLDVPLDDRLVDLARREVDEAEGVKLRLVDRPRLWALFVAEKADLFLPLGVVDFGGNGHSLLE